MTRFGLLLALETSTADGAGVALLEGERLLGERALAPAGNRNAGLLPAVDQLLAGCQRRLDEVDAIALAVGPGSFTGLRVGLATALGLCFGTSRPIVPVPTLRALALCADRALRRAALLDARKGQVYAGLYGPAGEPLAEDCVTDPIPWLERLRGCGPIAFLGSGSRLYESAIRSLLGCDARILAPDPAPRAASVGRLGARLAREGGALPPEQVRLVYLRSADAELAAAPAGHSRAKPIL